MITKETIISYIDKLFNDFFRQTPFSLNLISYFPQHIKVEKTEHTNITIK